MTKEYDYAREELLWRAGLLVLSGAAVVVLFVFLDMLDLRAFARPCLLHTLFGWYCPGCGGTRAVLAFFQGKFLTSFYYYPMIPYALGLFIWFMVSHTLRHLTHGKIPGLRYRSRYLYVILGLFLLGWIGKNAALACGIVLIK